MMRKVLFIICLLLIPVSAFSATYYVAQTAGGTGTGASYENRMSVASHNAATFSGDDVIYLCDTITSQVDAPSNGTSGHVITYRGDDAGHEALLQPSSMSVSTGAAISLTSRSYITLYNETTQAVIDGQITSGTVDTLFADGHDNHDLIDMTGASNITIDNWEFKRGYKVTWSTGASDITFTRCKFDLNRMGGLYFSGDSSNITIGGSSGNANLFDRNVYKTDYGTNKIGADIYLYQLAGFVVSYNYLHGTIGGGNADGWSMIGMAIYGANDGVIEYNTIGYYGAKNFRGAIHNKGLSSTYTNHDIIIRFNDIYSMPLDVDWVYAGTGNAIVLTRDTYNYRIYGNRIHEVLGGIGMDINGESSVPDGANNIHIQDIYIWANSFSNIKKSVFSTSDGYSANTDDYDDIWFVNNSVNFSTNATVAATSLTGPLSSNFNYGDSTNGTDDTGSNPHIHIKNNIFQESLYGQAIKYSVGPFVEGDDGNWLDLDYNLHFDSAFPGGYKISWGGTVYDFDSGSLPAAWEANSPTPGNPLFTDVSTGDLTLGAGSPAINAGVDLSATSIADITVEHYSGTAQTFTFDMVLDPTTSWATPPVIVTALQSEQTAPVIGAYTYAAGGADETAPTLLQGSVVDTSGAVLSLTLSEQCTGTAGFTITPSGGAATLTYSGGTGADRQYTISRPIEYDETLTLSYAAGDVADLSSNALDTITNEPIINTSVIGSPGVYGVRVFGVENPTMWGYALASAWGVAAGSAPVDETGPTAAITTADPSAVVVDSLDIAWTCTDANGIYSSKWRVGAAPDASNGTIVTGSTPYSATTSGFSIGANTLYAGCSDPTGNWGSDSITVNYSATPACSGDYGPTGHTNTASSLNAGRISATKITLECDGTTESIKAYLGSVNTDAREFKLAIYTDNVGEPDALVVSTAATYSVSGVGPNWETIALAQALTAGDYWLAFLFEYNASTHYYETSAGTSRYYRYGSYWPDFPATWPTASDTHSTSAYEININFAE